MMTNMEQFCEQLEQMAEVDLTETPGFKTLVALRDELSGKIPSGTLDKLLGEIEIEVDETFVADEELFQRSVKAFAKVICNLYGICMDEFQTERVFLGMLDALSLTAKGL